MRYWAWGFTIGRWGEGTLQPITILKYLKDSCMEDFTEVNTSQAGFQEI